MASHLPRPFTKSTMEALKIAIEQGNKLKTQKKAKVAPAPMGMTASEDQAMARSLTSTKSAKNLVLALLPVPATMALYMAFAPSPP
nr:unnamed protein product [Digitaria exilis]